MNDQGIPLQYFQSQCLFGIVIIERLNNSDVCKYIIFTYWSLGLSRRGLWIHARVCVRVCVRVSVTAYLEIRASDFSETLHEVASWRD